jgi:hypothetical protein
LELPGALSVHPLGREVEVLCDGNGEELLAALRAHGPEDIRSEALSLEDIFVASRTLRRVAS